MDKANASTELIFIYGILTLRPLAKPLLALTNALRPLTKALLALANALRPLVKALRGLTKPLRMSSKTNPAMKIVYFNGEKGFGVEVFDLELS